MDVTLANLKAALADKVKEESHHVQCSYRKCKSDGEFFLMRRLRAATGGYIDSPGFYCEQHDTQFGEQNLRRWAKESQGMVVWMRDAEGDFRGLRLPQEVG